jgi:hypothetical protein
MNRFVANIFVVPIGIGSIVLFGLSSFDKKGNFSPFTNNNTFVEIISSYFIFSLTYFIADLILLLINFNPKAIIYIIHHFICIISVSMINFFYFDELAKYMLAYLIFEVSNPFLNLAIYFRKNKISNIFTKLNDYIFLITYTLCRVIFGTYLLFNVVPEIYKLVFPVNCLLILPIILQIIIFWWYYKIIVVLIK